MSLSVFYHALGIYGYHHLKTERQEGVLATNPSQFSAISTGLRPKIDISHTILHS